MMYFKSVLSNTEYLDILLVLLRPRMRNLRGSALRYLQIEKWDGEAFPQTQTFTSPHLVLITARVLFEHLTSSHPVLTSCPSD